MEASAALESEAEFSRDGVRIQMKSSRVSSKKNLAKGLKGLLSLFLCFHLLCILAAPLKDTHFGRALGPWAEPYVNFLEIAASWNFFAPDPGPPPLFVEWEYVDAKGEPIGNGRWPEVVNPYSLRERQNRRITLARFMFNSEGSPDRILSPYLCRKEPRAAGVRLWKVVHTIPGLIEVAKGKRQIGDDVGATRNWIAHAFCASGEVRTLAGGEP